MTIQEYLYQISLKEQELRSNVKHLNSFVKETRECIQDCHETCKTTNSYIQELYDSKQRRN